MSLVPMLFRDETGKVIAMQLPKAYFCKDRKGAETFARVMNRPVLVQFDNTIGRMHPSGKFQDLSEEFAAVAAILADERQIDFTRGKGNASSKDESPRK